MSNEELVNAYSQGRISRRTLVRGLVAAGVSTGAAVSYAHLLAPAARAGERPYADEYPANCTAEYPSIDMLILDRKLEPVRKEKKLRVKARYAASTFSEGTNPTKAEIRLTVRSKKNGVRKTLGSKTVVLNAGVAREISIPLEDLSSIRGVDRATLFVSAKRVDSQVFCKPADPLNLIRIRGTLY